MGDSGPPVDDGALAAATQDGGGVEKDLADGHPPLGHLLLLHQLPEVTTLRRLSRPELRNR